MRNNEIFGGVDFAENGVWVTGSGTFSAPQRDVTVVSVPGRNGDLVIDNGKWNNITVTYPCFIKDDFEQNMASFRSLMCSKLGYQKLEDSYHPDEYRLGAFSDGLFPTMRQRNKGGEFDVVFNCKPQRFLKSGDESLQFMPMSIIANVAGTQYIPVNGDLDFDVNCPSDDTITVTIKTYDSSGTQLTTNDYSMGDGSSKHITFAGTDKYWRILVSNYADIDATWLKINSSTTYDDEPMQIDAVFARSYSFRNPTEYASTPLIEIYATALGHMGISNYVNGVRDDYYVFSITNTGVQHFWMDCDMQYLYDEARNNLTSKLTLTTAQSRVGEGLVFPRLGTNEIGLYMYYGGANIANGLGIVNIYPRWWTL